MTTWDANYFNLSDPINQEIWALSAQRGALLVEHPEQASFGGLQDLIPGVLPWVPDLVGRRCSEAECVVVVGSAYAPFVRPWATRSCAMDLSDCFFDRGLKHFQMKYLQNVVANDPAYYGPIADLLKGYVPLENIVLMDLCRASFVRRDSPTKVVSGDSVIRAASALYQSYVDAGGDWTWRRLGNSNIRLVIVLGNLAEKHLLAFLEFHGCKVAALGSPTRIGVRKFTVLFPDNRPPLICLGVAHPSWRNINDPDYTQARLSLASHFSLTRVEVPYMPTSTGSAPVGPSIQSPVKASPTGCIVVGAHFICRHDLNVKHVGDGIFETGVWVVSEKHLKTIRYIALHESKSQSSYRQGEVLGWHTVDHNGRKRIVFHVKEDRHSRSWVGEGTGEKGYAWE